MYSILIPTCNCECVSLVDELLIQINEAEVEAEIIVVDDASDDEEILHTNAELATTRGVRYIQLSKKIGIAAVRNRLIDEAKGDWLICVDADTFPCNTNFLQTYFDETFLGSAVICGGFKYRRTAGVNPLRFIYGSKYEVKSVEERSKNVYRGFIAMNYMVSKEIVSKIRFDENIENYGHEDMRFGICLEENNIWVKHINNPVFHDNIDTSEEFLEKTKSALNNLVIHKNNLYSHSHLLHFVDKLRHYHLLWGPRIVYKLFRKPMERNLLSDKPSLNIYNLYRLGYFLTIKNK